MADDLRDKIAKERVYIRTSAGKGILDMQAVERLKALLAQLETAEKSSPKREMN